MTKLEKFSQMTKAQLVAVAKEEYTGVTLDMKMLKGDMIEALLKAKKRTETVKASSGNPREPLHKK